jgi:hypothetical protein
MLALNGECNLISLPGTFELPFYIKAKDCEADVSQGANFPKPKRHGQRRPVSDRLDGLLVGMETQFDDYPECRDYLGSSGRGVKSSEWRSGCIDCERSVNRDYELSNSDCALQESS